MKPHPSANDRFAVFATALLAIAAAGANASPIRLRPGVPVELPAAASEPVRKAAEDLRRDLRAQLGADSPLLSAAPTDGVAIRIVVHDPDLAGPEAYRITVEHAAGEAPRVTLAGSDDRGAIYAIYAFSEKILGVPPLWYFAQWRPSRREAVDVPEDFSVAAASPRVRWRAWFFNDEDMLGPWESRDPAGRFDRILETLLRLRLNTVDLDSIADYPRPSTGLRRARQARDRGVIATNTHTSPLGAGFERWAPYWEFVRHAPAPPLRLSNLPALEEFWRYHIDLCRREHLDMIWTVGFRGIGDHGFFEAFPDAPKDDAGRARVVHDMMVRQIALLHREIPGPLRLRTTLYNETSDYYGAGLLRPPTDPELIWNFVAARRDHFPAADVRRGDLPPQQLYGYYLNLQFTSTGAHLAPAEGPAKIFRNLQIITQSQGRPPTFWVVNAGNVREFLLELSAHAEMAWDPDRWDPPAFVERWCVRYFGQPAAAAAAGIVRDYYDSYWTQRAPDLPDFPRQYLFQDMRVARACDELLADWNGIQRPLLDDRAMGFYRIDPPRAGAADRLTALQRGIGASAEKLSRVCAAAAALAPRIDPNGRRLWDDEVLGRAEVILEADRALLDLAGGFRLASGDPGRARALRAADSALARMRSRLARADAVPFGGWSDSEHLWGIATKRERIAELLSPSQPGSSTTRVQDPLTPQLVSLKTEQPSFSP